MRLMMIVRREVPFALVLAASPWQVAGMQKPVLKDALMLVGYSKRTSLPRAARMAQEDGVKLAVAELQNRGGYQPLMPLFPFGIQLEVRHNWITTGCGTSPCASLSGSSWPYPPRVHVAFCLFMV